MAFNVRMKQGVNIQRVVSKTAITVIALWIGGTILNEVGDILNGTSSPFYQGLNLIGWTVSTATNSSASPCQTDNFGSGSGLSVANCVQDTQGTGVLSVIGIIGVASIILEFIQVQF